MEMPAVLGPLPFSVKWMALSELKAGVGHFGNFIFTDMIVGHRAAGCVPLARVELARNSISSQG